MHSLLFLFAPLIGGDPALPLHDSAIGPQNALAFAAGTWRTAGLQYWPNGTWIEHRGIVQATLSEDGLTLTRVFWSSFDNGASLAGRSVHAFDPAKRTWRAQWSPTLGSWNATPSVGRMEGEEYVDVGRGVDQTGPYTARTRLFDISRDGYRVRTNIFYDSGEVSKDNWTARFERIQDEEQAEPEGHGGSLEFLLGDWMATGTLVLPDGSTATHTSFVDAHLAPDGHTIEREFWGSISTGAALRGVSTHMPRDGANAWDVRWIPAGAAANAVMPALGGFLDDGFLETQEQQLPTGTATIRTRYSEISPTGYSVQTDVLQADGAVSEAVWVVHFRRIG